MGKAMSIAPPEPIAIGAPYNVLSGEVRQHVLTRKGFADCEGCGAPKTSPGCDYCGRVDPSCRVLSDQ